ncbi:MAG: endonuclease NucS domain-containing protein [Vitreimonas sp.]
MKGAKPSTLNTYNSYLRRINDAIGGLDEHMASDGVEKVLKWGQTYDEEPFVSYPSHARSVLKAYVEFSLDESTGGGDLPPDLTEDDAEQPGLVFRLEREMHAAVRKQLDALETGLKEDDVEVAVATGRIDILARDKSNGLTVIELKAGICPPGALEQTLGYAQALEEERGESVRAILIAAEFPDRIRAAAKRSKGVELRTYEFAMRFHVVP